jgi:hypothetical protein
MSLVVQEANSFQHILRYVTQRDGYRKEMNEKQHWNTSNARGHHYYQSIFHHPGDYSTSMKEPIHSIKWQRRMLEERGFRLPSF